MSIYRFAGDSPVQEILFRYAKDRPPVALLAAGDAADPDQISTIRRGLMAEKWGCVPVHTEGRNFLQVEGFKDEGQLTALLHVRHFTSGKPAIHAEAGDHPTRSWQDWLNDNSLKYGGWANLVGDGALLASGLKSGRSKEINTGALYTVGGLIVSRYGNVKTEHHLRQVSEQLAGFLQQQAGMLPEHCGLYSILKDRRDNGLQKMEDFLYRYPSQATLGIYTLGAFSMLQSGIKHRKFWDAAYGVSSVSTKLASLVVPEKKKTAATESHEKATTPIGKVFEWVQEKPLRIFGYGSMVTDALLGMSAYREYKSNPQQKAYIFKFLTTGTYLMADMMFAISSKEGEGKFDPDEQRRIEGLAAETIAAQPGAIQGALTNQVAGFLSTRPEMRGSTQDIAESIGEQVKYMRSNRWACVPETTVIEKTVPEPISWKTRTSTSFNSTPQLG